MKTFYFISTYVIMTNKNFKNIFLRINVLSNIIVTLTIFICVYGIMVLILQFKTLIKYDFSTFMV